MYSLFIVSLSSDFEIQSTVGTNDIEIAPLHAFAYYIPPGYRVISHTTRRPYPSDWTPRRPPPKRPPVYTTRRPTTHTTKRPTTHTTSRPTTSTTRRPTTHTTKRPTTHTTRAPTTHTTRTRRPTTHTTRRPTTHTTRRPTTHTTKRPTIHTTSRPTAHTTSRPTTSTTRRPTTHTTKSENPFDRIVPVPGSGSKPGQQIILRNTYNYHYPGFYVIPVANPKHRGYYQTITTYKYSRADTGSGLLGFYIGYKLGKLKTPTYSHGKFYDGYRPRYDHYRVHHYYHDAHRAPIEPRIYAHYIVGCVGDSANVCTNNTISLCTTNGTLMCVVPIGNVVSCIDTDGKTVSCITSNISCANSRAPECGGSNNGTIKVNIPCLSTVKVIGSVKSVNNMLVYNRRDYAHRKSSTNCTKIISCVNNTTPECLNKTSIEGNTTCLEYSTNSTSINCTRIVSCDNNRIPECVNRTRLLVNVKCVNHNNTSANSTFTCTSSILCEDSECINNSILNVNLTCDPNIGGETKYVNNTFMNGTVDTIVPSEDFKTTTPSTTSSVHWLWKRSVTAEYPNEEFCVAVLAVPALRVPTEGEKVLASINSVVKNFIEAAWNL